MEKYILLATNNLNKIKEIKSIISSINLKGFKILSLNDINDNSDVLEDGETFEQNAYIKAYYYARKYDYLVVADDTGLIVEALGGLPGVHSKRYSSPDPTSEKNRNKLIKALEGVTNRHAYFKCCICLIDDKKEVHYFIGETHGDILNHEEGDTGFGYDSIFYSYDLKKTFGSCTLVEKDLISHRGIAVRKLAKYLEEKYGE